jgi:hypothetical protein
MARKLQARPAPPAPHPAGAPQALRPDVRVTIAGRDLVVREYAFFEGLEVAHQAQALIAAMHAAAIADGSLRYDRIRRLFGVHSDVVIPIAAQAADVEPDWVLQLSRSDAERFISAWFSANSSFFVHEVVVELREERQRAAALGLIGSSSSAGSLPPDLAISIDSADTPSASSSASTPP